jgi:hypothetical protein
MMKTFTLTLGVLLAAQAAWAQTPDLLHLKVLEGDGAINDILHKTGHPLVVEVRDENNQVVRGADVTFTVPQLGASGTFRTGIRTVTAKTNNDGVAQSETLVPNATEGRFSIVITARQGNREGTAVANQSNTMAGVLRSSSRKKLWIILGAAAGGTVGALTLRGGSNSTPGSGGTPGGVITVGGITVGAPR